MSLIGNWLSELERRRVFRVAAIYAVGAWAVVQGASAVLPMLGAPLWVGKVVLVLVALGFPVAVALAWAFDITPDGIRHAGPAAAGRGGRPAVVLFLILLAVGVGVGAWWLSRHGRAAAVPDPGTGPARSIAVLPFVNMSADAAQEYFSDGITEEILNALAQIPGLQVAGRTSSFAYKGRNLNLSEIGRALHVATVLEGSVQRAGNEVRITAQLIDTRTDYHIWSKRYDRSAENIFAVEDEISRAIADALELKLGARATPPPATANVRAHELYLRGIANIANRGPALNAATAQLAQAVALDSSYAAAWAALAQARELLPWYDLADWTPSLDAAERAARRALALDPDNGDAHCALANVLRDRLQFEAARPEYEAAVALNPSSAEAHNQFAQMLHTRGDLGAALAQEKKAVALDPLAPNPRYVLATLLTAGHRYDDAIDQFRIDIRERPDYRWSRSYLAMTLLLAHRYAEAEQTIRAAAAQFQEDDDEAARLVRAAADPAQRGAVLGLIDTTTVLQAAFGGMLRPVWYSVLGQREAALAALERWARDTGPGELYSRARDLWLPVFDPIRDDPRFRAVQRKLRIPATATPPRL